MRFIFSVIIFVSCISSTLAQDLSILESKTNSNTIFVDPGKQFDLNIVIDTKGNPTNGISLYLTINSDFLRVVDNDPVKSGIQPFKDGSFINEFILENDTHGDPGNSIPGFQLDYTVVSLSDWSEGEGIVATITLEAIAPIANATVAFDFDFPNARETAINTEKGLLIQQLSIMNAYIVNPDTINLGPQLEYGEKTRKSVDKIYSHLMAPYPNPANPEVWIPFELSEDSQIVIKIYNSSGEMVKNFDLVNLPAGKYLSRDKAIYWDGTNVNGENVISGLYFCILSAGKTTDVKKIIILK